MKKKKKRKGNSCFGWVVVSGRDTWRTGSSGNFESEVYFLRLSFNFSHGREKEEDIHFYLNGAFLMEFAAI